MGESLHCHRILLVIRFFSCPRTLRVVNAFYLNILILRIGLWVTHCIVTGLFPCHRIPLLSEGSTRGERLILTPWSLGLDYGEFLHCHKILLLSSESSLVIGFYVW
jgi:hypothetical protein